MKIGSTDLAATTGRYAQFYDAIKAKYPQSATDRHAPVKSCVPDVIDEHYYRSRGGDVAARITTTISPQTVRRSSVGEWATRDGIADPELWARRSAMPRG